jgi:hypothetical protein
MGKFEGRQTSKAGGELEGERMDLVGEKIKLLGNDGGIG